MRIFQISVLASTLGLALVLSGCSSTRDSYSKEFPSAAQSARTVAPTYQSNAFASPSVAYQQGQTIEIRSDLMNLSCDSLAYEDKRMTNMAQFESPSYEDMMTQLRLLEVRAALYARCNQPSVGDAQAPQFTVPIEEAMNADQIREARRLQRLSQAQSQIVSVAPAITVQPIQSNTFVRNVRNAPPVIETVKIRALPQLQPQTTSSVSQTFEAPVQGNNQIQGQYQTIEKFGDTVRVRNVSYEDLPLIAGPELAAN